MQQENVGRTLKERIRSGQIRREDVIRRLAELAFGRANDCVRLALEDAPALSRLDLSLLSEVKRNDKGTVEIRLIDRLKALEQLPFREAIEVEGKESFTLTVTHENYVEIYPKCYWLSITLEENGAGLLRKRIARSWTERVVEYTGD